MRTRQQTRLLEESHGVEEGGSSTVSAQDDSPQRKKRALTKATEPSNTKKLNRIKGKLSGVLSLPIEVFTEIMRYLALPDVLSLSRSNKFFRQMLMTPSVSTLSIWRSAVENVPGLPPCPEGLCEPQYAALIYTKYCSMCGIRIVKDMDPYLNVRICKDCIEIHVTHVDEVDDDILRPLVPRSKITRMKASRYGMKTCLLRDLAKAKRWYDDITTSDLSSDELDAELEDRLRLILGRLGYAKQMEEFLRRMAKTRAQEIDRLKEQRREDIKRRLKDAGWEERDWIFPEFVARKWASLVEAPQALTDRAWQKLYPSMLPYLECNRRSHTQCSKAVREGKRLRRMRRLLLGIRNHSSIFGIGGNDIDEDEPEDDPMDVSTASNVENSTTSSGGEFSSTTESESDGDIQKPNTSAPLASYPRVGLPFPPMVDLLKWPIISSLLEADTDADTMQERFEELRDEIEDQIRSWGSQVEEELMDILKAGSKGDQGAESSLPRLQLQNKNVVMDSLSPAARLLLRADSVFRVSEENGLVAPMPLYFPEIFSILQARPEGYSTSAFNRFDGSRRSKYGYTWDSSEVEFYWEGSAAAKALLAQLGRQDAAQYELQALGARFTCGSCGDKWPRSWNEMVQHYTEAIIHATIAKKAKASVKKQVKYNNSHSLHPKTKHKPLLVLHNVEEVEVLSSKYRKFENLVRCGSCKQLGIDFQSSRGAMLKHVRAVHGIKAPKAENYERAHGVQRHITVSDPTADVSESTEATDQELTEKIVSNYASYGTCVFWSDYSRHTEMWRWREFFERGMYQC